MYERSIRTPSIDYRSKKEVDDDDPETELNMKINAIVANNAEHYYRTMITDDNESWNIRDRHMVEALHHISEFYGF